MTTVGEFAGVITIGTDDTLTRVARQGLHFYRPRIGYIDVVGGMEEKRLYAKTNFIKVQTERMLRPHPCLDRKHAGDLVILVRVDGPLGEYHIRVLGR